MRNLKSIYIVVAGSAIITLFALICVFISSFYYRFHVVYFAILPLMIGAISFLTFYFLIKIYITERLKILYRSIRTGKFVKETKTNYNLNDNLIDLAEKETSEWAKERTLEITTLKDQEQFRREFLGNLAHELKTPAFSIQGYILTLLDGGLEDKDVNRKFLERASKAAERMTLIIEDLDKITKMEANQYPLDYKSFDIKELITEVFDALDTKAKRKNITLQFAKDFDPVYVNADRIKISQVLINLLNNSINYGKEGGESEIRFYRVDDIISIEVSDDGIGIKPEEIPRLFERFYRVEKSRNRNEGGSGLGLAIVKHIIEAHEQSITVRSTIGVGSTFTFSLNKG